MNKWHRWFNTGMTTLVLGGLVGAVLYGSTYYKALVERQAVMSEIGQIVADEGFKSCSYKDTRGKDTIGFGHLITKDDNLLGKCITKQDAIKILYNDYMYAKDSVEVRYPWAEGEVKLVLTNMTYQLGSQGVSEFDKSLSLLKKEEYMAASMEMLDSKWHSQTDSRSTRLAIRILALQE